MELISTGKRVLTYDDIITEMIINAWFMVTDCNLRLGPSNTTDNLEKAVKYLYHNLYDEKIKPTENKIVLRNLIKNEKDEQFISIKKDLIDDVPYCMQSPFYPDIKSPKKIK